MAINIYQRAAEEQSPFVRCAVEDVPCKVRRVHGGSMSVHHHACSYGLHSERRCRIPRAHYTLSSGMGSVCPIIHAFRAAVVCILSPIQEGVAEAAWSVVGSVVVDEAKFGEARL